MSGTALKKPAHASHMRIAAASICSASARSIVSVAADSEFSVWLGSCSIWMSTHGSSVPWGDVLTESASEPFNDAQVDRLGGEQRADGTRTSR